MSTDQRFGIICILLSALLACAGFLIRISIKTYGESIKRNTHTDDEILSLRRHDEKTALVVADALKLIGENHKTLTSLYMDLAGRQSRMEGQLSTLVNKGVNS